MLLYGTSTNLVASAAFLRFGAGAHRGDGLSPVGFPVAVWASSWWCCWARCCCPSREGKGGVADWSLRDYLTEAMLPADSRYLGKELAEITEGLGLRVIGSSARAGPARGARLPAGDERLIIEGNREDILRVKDLQGIEIRPDMRLSDTELRPKDTLLVEASVPPGSPLVGRSLKETLFLERYGLVALALHRKPAIQRLTKLQLLGRLFGGQSLSTLPLSVGDVLLLRGPRSRCSSCRTASTCSSSATWSTSRRATPRRCWRWCSSSAPWR